MKNLLLIALVLLAVSGCKKEEVVGPQGPQGIQGPQGEDGAQGENGSQATVYDFTLTFGTSTTVQTYHMPDGSMYDKVTLVYLDKGYKQWVLLPFYENNSGYVPVNYVATCNEVLERIEIRTDRGDNEVGSPWAINNVQRDFRAVVLETSGIDDFGDIDFGDVNQVQERFGIKF